ARRRIVIRLASDWPAVAVYGMEAVTSRLARLLPGRRCARHRELAATDSGALARAVGGGAARSRLPRISAPPSPLRALLTAIAGGAGLRSCAPAPPT